MSLKKALFWMSFVLMVPLVSCNLEDDTVNFHFVNLQVVEAELPESFELLKTYEVKVTYLNPNNCTFFEGFNVAKTGPTERMVVAVGSQLDEAACAQVADEVVEYFAFTCYYTDTYVFRFWSGLDAEGNPQYLEYQVPVEP